jgi:hypothetical protein
MTRDQLIKDYAAIIDKQKLEIEGLKAELEEYRSIAEKMGAQKAISEKEQWGKCAEKLALLIGPPDKQTWADEDQINEAWELFVNLKKKMV